MRPQRRPGSGIDGRGSSQFRVKLTPTPPRLKEADACGPYDPALSLRPRTGWAINIMVARDGINGTATFVLSLSARRSTPVLP